MKKVLILVISTDEPPYDKMITTSLATWDSVEVECCETIYYTGKSHKPSTDKIKYLPIDNDLFSMGKKNLAIFDWALKNKDFDYVARVNASCYVNKEELLKYCQNLPNENLFAGSVADSQNGFKYVWGGGQFIISRDVINKIVDNKEYWAHSFMEDESMSLLVEKLGIPFTAGYSAAIDNMGDHWRLITYGGEGVSITFTEFADVKKLNHHFYRVKQDQKRWVDEFIMHRLFETLTEPDTIKEYTPGHQNY